MKNLNKNIKRFIQEKIYFAETDFNIRLCWLPIDKKFTVTVFFTDETIINKMKAEIIL